MQISIEMKEWWNLHLFCYVFLSIHFCIPPRNQPAPPTSNEGNTGAVTYLLLIPDACTIAK